MAQVLAPGVAQMKLAGTVSGNPWVSILHFYSGPTAGTWTAVQLQAMANAMMAELQSGIQTSWGSNVTLSSAVGTDIGTATPNIGVSNHAAFSGTATGLTIANTCMMFNYITNVRYRGGHGRTYLPGGADNFTLDGDHWNSSFTGWVTTMATAIANANSAATSNGQPACQQCIPLFNYKIVNDTIHNKYLRTKDTFKVAAIVQGVTGLNEIRSQRRRLGGR